MNTTRSPSQIPWPVKYLTEPPSRMFSVLNWSPQMGWGGTTIAIDTEFNNSLSHQDVRIRIVIGEKPISTEIKALGPDRENHFRCTGVVPDFESHNMSSTHTVCLTIQALGPWNDLLDQVRFGYFTYRKRHGPSMSIPLGPGVLNVPRKGDTYLHLPQLPTPHTDAPGPRVKAGTSSPPLESQSQNGGVIPPEYLQGICRYEGNEDSNKRKHGSENVHMHQHDKVAVELDFEEDPTDLGDCLSLEEERLNRRLVKFICKVHEGKLRVSFHPIRPEQYDERDVVISCIRSHCGIWYTSVDIIRVIEHIMKGQFIPGGDKQIGPEEKSRIRRNLESLSPTTVTKRKQNATLYKLIMDFPAPKPRHIEKEIKVFEWKTLMAGIIKVVEKFSWCNEAQSHKAPTSHSPAAPYPLAPFTSSDGAGMPVDSRQPNLAPALHVSPFWLYCPDVTLGSLVTGPPSVGEEEVRFPSPRPYTPSHAIQMPAPYEPFHHFDSLEWQPMRGHSTHAGMASSFF